jgi:ferric-dicitrate binding protein FerR (iron transport regulator)
LVEGLPFLTVFIVKSKNMETFEKEDTVRLIAKYLEGLALEEEIRLLEKWMNASPQNKEYFFQLKNIWEVSGKQVDPSDINPEEALKKVLASISQNKPKPGIWFYWQKVAAVLLIPLLIAGLWWVLGHGLRTSSTPVVYNEAFATFGTRSALKLADGSLVWLNSGSTLKYPDRFNEKQRVVYLKGEAYFEVKSNKSWPFIVQTRNLQVKATGTKFNVQAFDNDRLTEVSLAEGKVTVDRQGSNGKFIPVSVLKPNQHLEYDNHSGTSKLMNEDAYKYIAWKDGKLIFRNQPLSEVVKKISQLYHVDIELRGKELQEYRYRATFQEESLNEILKLLKLSSPIDYHEVARNPLPDGSFPKRKIIIFPVNEPPKTK